MKTNKVNYTKLTATAAIACLLAVTCHANAAQCKARSAAVGRRSNLDEAARTNHNSLLPASFYESNHLIDG
jgi:hypothetical protein